MSSRQPSTDNKEQQQSNTNHVNVNIPAKINRSRMLVGESENVSTLATTAKTLRFKSPKESDDGYLCIAVLPHNKRLQVRLADSRVRSVVNGVSKTRKLTIDVTKDQARQFMSLDAVVLEYVKLHVENWFDGKMDDALVEEYYRPTIMADSGNGVCAKVHVSAKSLPKDLKEGDHSLCLQLTGIHFRKQHFTLVWKYVDHMVSNPCVLSEKDAGEYDDEEEEEEEEEDDTRSALMYSGESRQSNNTPQKPSRSRPEKQGKQVKSKKDEKTIEMSPETAVPVSEPSDGGEEERKGEGESADGCHLHTTDVEEEEGSVKKQQRRLRDERGAEETPRVKNNDGRNKKSRDYDFVSDEEDIEYDDPKNVRQEQEQESIPLPNWDEYENMRESLLARLDARVRPLADLVDMLKNLHNRVSSAENQDMRTLEMGWDVLDDTPDRE